jgi:Mg2+-importing ATPase
LCTDKTGTLTNDHVVMIQYLDCHEASSLRVLQFAYLNAFFQTGLKNLLDKAIIEFGDSAVDLGMSNYATLKWEKIDEIPFDFERRRLSVILEEKGPGHDPSNDKKRIMVTKGALEEMLNACSWVQESDDESSLTLLTDDKRTQLLTVGEKLNIDGLRVLVVATKILPLKGFENFSGISNRKLEVISA